MKQFSHKRWIEVPCLVEDGKVHYGYWQGDVRWSKGLEMTPTDPWEATLYLEGYSRGRSSVKVLLSDRHNPPYEMFLKDFMEIVEVLGYDPESGISGTWGFRKAGQNYGVFLMEEKS